MKTRTPRAHVALDLSGLSMSLRLTPGEVRHPLLVAISDSSEPASRPEDRGHDPEPSVDDEGSTLPRRD